MQYSLTCKQEYFLGENIMKHINENGRSMVEMLGVLAIIGVLSVGGIAGYSKAMNKYKINKTTDQVSMLVANLRTLFSSQGDYAGLNNGQAIKFGVVPNDMYAAASNNTYASNYAIKNAFGGSVTIEADAARSAGDSGSEAFVITYEGLTPEACVTIATGDWGSGQASGLIAIAAGKDVANSATKAKAIKTDTGDAGLACGDDTCVVSPGAVTAAKKAPMTVSDAVAACSATGSNNVVAWKYY